MLIFKKKIAIWSSLVGPQGSWALVHRTTFTTCLAATVQCEYHHCQQHQLYSKHTYYFNQLNFTNNSGYQRVCCCGPSEQLHGVRQPDASSATLSADVRS